MNARELYDRIVANREDWREFLGIADKATLIRALDLLARVEESEDELALELRETYKWRDPKLAELCDKAAARIVAQDERIKALEAERDIYKAHILSAPKEEA